MSETLRDERRFWFACIDIDVIRAKDLSVTDKVIYAVLCTYANVKEQTCFPKVKKIAEDAGCSDRSVQRSLKDLEEKGYITRTPRFLGKEQISTEYTIIGASEKPAPKKESPQTGGDRVTRSHRGGDRNIPPELDPKELDTLPTGEGDAPAEKNICEKEDPETETVPLEDVPVIMQPTVRLLLLETGRKGINTSELACLKALEKAHLPARIQAEIQTALTRFRKNGRPLYELTFEYIFQALKHQKSLKPSKPKEPSKAPPKGKTEAEREAEEGMQKIYESLGLK